MEKVRNSNTEGKGGGVRWCFFSRFEINFGVTLYDMTKYMYITITSKPFTTVINWDTSMVVYNVLYPVPFFTFF